jgi:hypothetical protein
MDNDNDALMLEQSDGALTVLMVKFRMASIDDRATMRPSLMKLIDDSADFRLRLVKEGVITTEDDLKEMGKIRDEIDAAGSKQALLLAIARTAAFIATKI